MAAVAVTFSFAVISCSGNKTNNAAASEGEEATVETVEPGMKVELVDNKSVVTKCYAVVKEVATACDKKADCAEKKECCDKK